MSEQLIWMTPESFVERFAGSPSLLGFLIKFMPLGSANRDMDLARALIKGADVSLSELLKYRMVWHSDIAHVFERKVYVKLLQEGSLRSGLSPLVDKVTDLVFITAEEALHESLIGLLYPAHEKGSDAAIEEMDAMAAYIISGYGYYRSSQLSVFLVGKKLLDANKMDSDDETIIEGRLAIIENTDDLLRVVENRFR